MKYYIHNLEFTEHRSEMTIFGYTFKRVEDYKDRLKRLSHHINYVGEFGISITTGEHQITATVETPTDEPISPLNYGMPKPVLEDVLLILSLFTGREVFSSIDDSPIGIKRDARPYLCYQTLGVSIPTRFVENDWGQTADIGFEEGLDRVLKLIHSKWWLDKFDGGIVLFLARQMFIFQVLERAFLIAYVLWEHVFYIENKGILSEKDLKSIDGAQKVRVLLEKYKFISNLNGKQKNNIWTCLTKPRNDLTHYWRFRIGDNTYSDAVNFIELTTRLLAKILGLDASDGKNTQQWLEELIDRSLVSVSS